MDLFKLQGNERVLSTAALATLIISIIYLLFNGGLGSLSQNGLMLIAASAIMGFVGMSQRGGAGQLFAVGSLAIAVIIIAKIVFGVSFGLSVI